MTKIRRKACVIGAGFSGLVASSSLAKAGFEVELIEKNDKPGGRARLLQIDGFQFDMGPSWYWMPDVFEDYFQKFGYLVSDFYDLKRLNPSYKVVFEDFTLDVPANFEELKTKFDTIEKGSGARLEQFIKQAGEKYRVGMKDLVFRPSLSLLEFVNLKVFKGLLKMNIFQSMSSHVRHYFKNEYLQQLMEFPVLFLGGTPKSTPALYSMMNYADIALGTWYPMGGMHKIAEAMAEVAKRQDVAITCNEEVKKVETKNNEIRRIETTKRIIEADVFVNASDYHHFDQELLPDNDRTYTERYWDSRTMAPSSLIFYLGVNKKIDNLHHHNLFFDKDFNRHAHEIYQKPSWPSDPLFYVSATSKTDESVAPKNCENLFILVPIAPGLDDAEKTRLKYYKKIMDRLEAHTKQDISNHVIVNKSYCVSDFKSDYNSFKGNAYGLANTLMQTAVLKPSIKSKKLKNLFHTGQLTVPGPGVPPAIISGQVVANLISKQYNMN